MAGTRKNRKCSRKNTRKERKCSRKNLEGGRRRSGSRKLSVNGMVGKPAGAFVTGAKNVVVTAGKSALDVFDSLVRGVVKTGRSATKTVNRTVRAAVSRKNRKNRKNRKY